MFEISFGELLMIGLVALVVLGPERLPTVARTLGALVARAQRFVAGVKADIGRQGDLTGLSSLKQEVQQTAYALKEQLTAEIEQASVQVREAGAEALALPGALVAEGPAAATTAGTAAAPAAPTVPDSPLPAAAVDPLPQRPPVDDNQPDLFADPPSAPPSPSEKQQ